MKFYTPPKRLVELGLVLQYDTFLQEKGLTALLSSYHRMLINQERSKIMSGYFNYTQTIDDLIESILLKIKEERWKPKIEIQYD